MKGNVRKLEAKIATGFRDERSLGKSDLEAKVTVGFKNEEKTKGKSS